MEQSSKEVSYILYAGKIIELFIISDAFCFVGVYFGHSSMHDVPTSKASLHKFLRDGNVTFKIYCRPLHQRTPTQVGEAHLRMTDILKSEIFSFCKDVEVVYSTKVPDCQVVIGLLKVTVKLGARWKQLGGDFPDRLNKESLSSDTSNSCENRKHDNEASLRHMSDPTPAPRCDGLNTSSRIFNNEASLRHMSDPTPAPRCDGLNTSSRIFNNEASLRHMSDPTPAPRCDSFSISSRISKNVRKEVMSCGVSKEQQFCKNDQQMIELVDEVVYPSPREVGVNKVSLAFRCIELLSHFVIRLHF
jgi:hypothetical protein